MLQHKWVMSSVGIVFHFPLEQEKNKKKENPWRRSHGVLSIPGAERHNSITIITPISTEMLKANSSYWMKTQQNTDIEGKK